MFLRVMAAFALLGLAGCAVSAPADVLPYQSPADPDADQSREGPTDVVVGYQHRTPVRPKSWRQQNREVSPGGDS